MATKTLAGVTGAASVGGTWVGGSAPNSGDDIVIPAGDYKVTVDTSVAWGAITAADATTTHCLELASGITFQCKSSEFGGRGVGASIDRLIINPGVNFIADATSGDFQLKFGKLVRLVVNTAAGSPITFTKTGANTAGFAQNADQYAMLVVTTGDGTVVVTGWTADPVITWPNQLAVVDADRDIMVFDRWKFDGCGCVDMSGYAANDMPWKFTNGTVINSVGTYSFKYAKGAATGANIDISGSVFDGQTLIAESDVIADDTVFLNQISISGSGKAASWQYGILCDDAGGSGQLATLNADLMGCIYYMRADDPYTHFDNWTGLYDREISYCIYAKYSTAGEGGDLLTNPQADPATPLTVRWHHNLVLPTELGGSTAPYATGQPFAPSKTTANAEIICENNTMYIVAGSAGSFLGEHLTQGDYTGQCSSWKNNLGWNRVATPSGYLIDYQVNAPPGDVKDDWVLPGDCTNNAAFGLESAGAAGGAYNLPTALGGHGANDVNGVDPLFVDETRSMLTWAQTIDAGITDADGVIELLKTKNDDGVTGVSGFAAYTWITAGHAPQASQYDGAASDDGTIGAIAFAASSGPTPVPNLMYRLHPAA